MFKNIILIISLAFQLNRTPSAFRDEPLTDQTHPVDQDQDNDVFVSYYGCRERLDVRRFSLEETCRLYYKSI